MDGLALVFLGVAALAALVATTLYVSRRRLARAVDDAVDRIGLERPSGLRARRAEVLGRALDELERGTARAHRERARIAGAIEAAEIGVIITDDDGQVVFSNLVASRFLGSGDGQAVAEARVREAIEEVVVSREAVSSEIEILTPRRRVLRIHVVPLEQGVESVGAAVYIVDVTEERRVDAVRRDFVANVGHELKTPIGALAVLAETLSSHLDDPAITSRFAERLHVESTRLSKLLEDVLDLSQVEAMSGSFEPVALTSVVEDVLGQATEQAEAAGIQIAFEPVPPDAVVSGDPRQLRSLVANLVDNAIEYSDAEEGRPAPKVAVRVTTGSGSATIAVADEGIGIPDAHLDRIFERFYRVDRGRSRATGGTGLGLSIVRHIAKNHGGSVAVTSSLGEGSVFSVTLPIWRDA